MIAAVAGLAFGAFAALSLAMDKHARDVLGASRATPRLCRALRIAGWIGLAVAFALAVLDSGWNLGPVLWLGALTASALALVLWLLPYAPRAVVPAAWLVPLAGIAIAALLRAPIAP